jgi:hypothetical protein
MSTTFSRAMPSMRQQSSVEEKETKKSQSPSFLAAPTVSRGDDLQLSEAEKEHIHYTRAVEALCKAIKMEVRCDGKRVDQAAYLALYERDDDDGSDATPFIPMNGRLYEMINKRDCRYPVSNISIGHLEYCARVPESTPLQLVVFLPPHFSTSGQLDLIFVDAPPFLRRPWKVTRHQDDNNNTHISFVQNFQFRPDKGLLLAPVSFHAGLIDAEFPERVKHTESQFMLMDDVQMRG